MRYLLISILVTLFSGCKVATVKNYIETEVTTGEIHNPYFSNTAIDYVYKANIMIYGNTISGIFIVKKLAEKKHRMVFTSQFGSTFFDIEFVDNTYIIRTIAPELNKKMILNILLQDLSLLIKENDRSEGQYHNKNFNVLKSQSEKQSNYYFYNQSDVQLQKIVHTTRTKEKFEIHFKKISEDTIAEEVVISHNNIKLTIELNRLNK